MKLPVYKLDINEWDEETGIEFVSLVESPAIQKDFLAFNQEFVEPNPNESEDEFISRCVPILINEGKDNEQAVAICYSYWEGKFQNDYPQAAVDNAIRGMELNEKIDNECATLVGKARANQLANRENLSMETIERTYSFLSRAKEYYNPDDTEACGTISYLLWGGEEMLRWCERILKVEGQKFAIQDEEKRIVTGAAMIADLPIYRRDDIRGEYYVVFDKESIFKIAKKWARGNKYDAVNTHHRTPIMDGVSLFESYIIDRERGVMPPKGFEEVADGSWFVSYLVDNDDVWARVKEGEFKGFSVEGVFDFPEDKDEQILEALKEVLSKWNGK
jgi:hypothetical protein